MAKSRDVSVTIAPECTRCAQNAAGRKYSGVSRYTTRKNRRNTPTRMESKKFRTHRHQHTTHGEVRK
uniref:Large ribosomal subunit protein bL33c n=2 Tax=Selaginella TaxID=3246 RepID=A0A482CI79_9TRAC|nr:ribosomal protein L33 [Selaginella sanguinolenta]QBL76353.1 ribosomal protein L33 [Selaginella sanguinolenta]QGU93114.1 ribosomal protein L33 [Selaginella nummulariifolia]QGU93253.1 ribosomal protein L33 [Selaginella sanguinolenta]